MLHDWNSNGRPLLSNGIRRPKGWGMPSEKSTSTSVTLFWAGPRCDDPMIRSTRPAINLRTARTGDEPIELPAVSTGPATTGRNLLGCERLSEQFDLCCYGLREVRLGRRGRQPFGLRHHPGKVSNRVGVIQHEKRCCSGYDPLGDHHEDVFQRRFFFCVALYFHLVADQRCQ